jgi:hypothetical protein
MAAHTYSNFFCRLSSSKCTAVDFLPFLCYLLGDNIYFFVMKVPDGLNHIEFK